MAWILELYKNNGLGNCIFIHSPAYPPSDAEPVYVPFEYSAALLQPSFYTISPLKAFAAFLYGS